MPHTYRDVICTASNLNLVVGIETDDENEEERYDFTGVNDVDYVNENIMGECQRLKPMSSGCAGNDLAADISEKVGQLDSADTVEVADQVNHKVELVYEHHTEQ